MGKGDVVSVKELAATQGSVLLTSVCEQQFYFDTAPSLILYLGN